VHAIVPQALGVERSDTIGDSIASGRSRATENPTGRERVSREGTTVVSVQSGASPTDAIGETSPCDDPSASTAPQKHQ